MFNIKNETDFVNKFNFYETELEYLNTEQYNNFNIILYYINNILYNENEKAEEWFDTTNLDNIKKLAYLITFIDQNKLRDIL